MSFWHKLILIHFHSFIFFALAPESIRAHRLSIVTDISVTAVIDRKMYAADLTKCISISFHQTFHIGQRSFFPDRCKIYEESRKSLRFASMSETVKTL